MNALDIIDAFPAFQTFWPTVRDQPLPAQLDAWADTYMAAWPALRQLQIDDYTNQGDDWRAFAAEHVFPYLNERLPAMREAHAYLPDLCRQTYTAAQAQLNFRSDVIFIIYVGIGLGAGWVTRYENRPAILFGLENIAECGWSNRPALHGLIAHEIGHLVHFHWREQKGLPLGDDPWWRLYSEGFAQSSELQLTGHDRWHIGVGNDWLTWCQANRARLARMFLDAVANDALTATRDFFGSWYNIDGYAQTGYYLGWEIVRRLAAAQGTKATALLVDWETPVHHILLELAGADA